MKSKPMTEEVKRIITALCNEIAKTIKGQIILGVSKDETLQYVHKAMETAMDKYQSMDEETYILEIVEEICQMIGGAKHESDNKTD